MTAPGRKRRSLPRLTRCILDLPHRLCATSEDEGRVGRDEHDRQRRQRPGAARRARGAGRGARRPPSSRGGHRPGGRTASTARRRSRTSSASARSRATRPEPVFDADHPEVFAATDNGITPIEYLLVGLASCLTAGVASVAQNRGIQLRSVESTVEGNHDIRGILGVDSDVRNGFNDIKVTFEHRRGRLAGRRSRRWSPSRRSAPRSSTPSPTRRTSPSRSPDADSPSSASPPSSSAPATPASPPATSSASGRSTTSCSSAARWRTRGAASAGTRCGCSRPTGRAGCRAFAYEGPDPDGYMTAARSGRAHRRGSPRVSRAPVRTGIRTSRRCGAPTTGTGVTTDHGEIQSPDRASIASGACNRPTVPAFAARAAARRRAADAVRLPQPRPSSPTAACSSSAPRRPACSWRPS